ncbi:hypothetical protein [Dendronalium sp. ChiSLP03b]|uniref:hypothetical protein n=1 Tax=Dendronalium sp. ChiSLP03b TaxID=3075381 RepID=UPI002AD6AB4C|nr:hypothetical protein [Dendronalium sp. ChiSLP03b]
MRPVLRREVPCVGFQDTPLGRQYVAEVPPVEVTAVGFTDLKKVPSRRGNFGEGFPR